MKDLRKTKDKRLVLLDALIRCADESGSTKPHFYKDEMLKRLDVCDHVFNIMQKQLGDRYCRRMDDCLDERSEYAINVNKCLELRDQIIQANIKEKHREGIEIKLLATLIGTFLVILVVF
jgi:predicted metal-binding transcription factor (methanogenesis marker protein 9)